METLGTLKERICKLVSSIRGRIFIIMSAVVALQSAVLVIALVISQVFMALDTEAFRQFKNTAINRADTFNESTNILIGNTVNAVEVLSSKIENIASKEKIALKDLYKNDVFYEKAVFECTDIITNFLRDNNVTGSFVIFTGSNKEKQATEKHSAVYIRNTAPDVARGNNSNYQLEIGPALISKEFGINIGHNWDIQMTLKDKNNPSYKYYYMPISASQDYINSNIKRFGYWSTPVRIFEKDRDNAVTYTLPILDKQGTAFGFFGFEISSSYITKHYLPSDELAYENSFFTLSTLQNNNIDLSWFVPSSPVAQVYLEQVDRLNLKKIRSYGFFEVNVPSLEVMYAYTSPLQLYNLDSPFIEDDDWVITTYVSKSELHEASKKIRSILIVSIVSITLTAFVLVFILTYFSTKQISKLPDDIKNFDPYSKVFFKKTGLREIDELTSAIEILNASIINSSEITSKIMELTDIPVGGYEIVKDSNYVTVTDFVRQLMGKKIQDSISIK